MAITDKLTAIANAIRTKTSESGTMTLAQMPQKILDIQSGGNQPTLYGANVSSGYNTKSWSKSSQNGSFGAVKGTIDDVEYSSPLTITSAMNGKYLEIETYAENFISYTQRHLLAYYSASNSAFSVADGDASTNYSVIFQLHDTTNFYPEGCTLSGGYYYSPSLTTDSSGVGSGNLLFSIRAMTSTMPTCSIGVRLSDGTEKNGSYSLSIIQNGTTLYVVSGCEGLTDITEYLEDGVTIGDQITFIVNFTQN